MKADPDMVADPPPSAHGQGVQGDPCMLSTGLKSVCTQMTLLRKGLVNGFPIADLEDRELSYEGVGPIFDLDGVG